MASIRLKKKNSWCTSRGRKVQNSGPWGAWQALYRKRYPIAFLCKEMLG